MPQSIEALLLLIGAVFFLIGLFGGGVESQAFKLPPIGRYARIGAMGIGAVFMIISILRLFSPPALPSAIAIPSNLQTSSPVPCLPEALCEVSLGINDGEIFNWAEPDSALTYDHAVACAHSSAYGLQLDYNFPGTNDNGGWGIHWANTRPSHLDVNALGRTELVFWVKGEVGGETFQIGMKDTDGIEVKLESKSLVIITTGWTEAIIPLSKFQGVNTRSLENISFGFHHGHGASTVCIDDITFR